MKRRLSLILTGILLLTGAACNLGTTNTSQPDLAATITAQALALQMRAGTPTATAPTGLSAATLRVRSATECRAGPSQEFELAFVAHPGGVFKLAGKNAGSNYWIVQNPAGGTCWLSGVKSVVAGSTDTLPELPLPAPVAKASQAPETSEAPADSGQLYRWVTIQPPQIPSSTAPPTKVGLPLFPGTILPLNVSGATSAAPTMSVLPPLIVTVLPPALGRGPNSPTLLAFERSCEQLSSEGALYWLMTIHLTWQDSSNETGYRVLLGYYPLATLPLDSTQYTTGISHNDAGTGSYPPPEITNIAVEAFNDNGPSPRAEVWVPTCP